MSQEKVSFEKPIRISSNLTMMLALFLPTFWMVFFGLFALAILFSDQSTLPFPGIPYIRWVILAIVLFFFLIIRFTIMKLRRVEVSNTHFFASNYFKTYSYAFQDIEKITELNFGLFQVLKLRLKYKGKFGKKISFLLNKTQLNFYLENVDADDITSILKK